MRRFFTVLAVCLISTGAFAQTPGSPGGLVVFETFGSAIAADATSAGVLAGAMTTQTVVFASASVRLSRDLGVAIVNPGGITANVTLTLRRGSDGTVSGVRTFAVAPRQQVAQFISELFANLPDVPPDFDGSLSIVSDNPVSIMGLRFRGTTFSTIPITSLSNPIPFPQISLGVGGANAVVLPQFAAGGGWSSQIVMSNTTALPMTVRVDLFKSDSTALTTNLNGQSGATFQNVVIPAQGIVIENNNDPGTLQVGYVVVTPLDVTTPMVISTVPANGTTGVALTSNIAATFNELMTPSTIGTSTFTVAQGTTAVPGVVTYTGTTATFTPIGNFVPATTYSATITTGAKDLSGTPLAGNYTWNFTTGAGITSPTIPMVISTVPANGAIGVPINTKVAAAFNEPMNSATITTSTFTLQQGLVNVVGTVNYLGTAATFTPASNLAINTPYTATITTAARDLSGNPLSSNYVWNFTTGATINLTAPTVTAVNPLNGANNVALTTTPSATFSEAMDPLTMTSANFTVTGPGVTVVTGAVTYNALSKTATFTPTSNLASGATFTATITTGAKDLSGNPLAANFTWSFSTNAPLGPGPIALGAAAPYGILGGAGVTNSGPTVINGSLGTSPTGTLTGSPTVTGSIDLANPAAAAAKLALTAAFNTAAGESLNAISLPGDISGLTLAPGLYKNSTSVMLSTGNVTLDAQGDPNATWTFQMGSTLTTFVGTQVVLAGGAKAGNIYWQVGSSATLGTTSIFQGNIMAAISISVGTGAVIDGRLLTQTGAVSLLSDTVTVPGP